MFFLLEEADDDTSFVFFPKQSQTTSPMTLQTVLGQGIKCLPIKICKQL